MNIQVFDDYEELSKKTAVLIAGFVADKPDATLCFPAGDTPSGVYRELGRMFREGKADFSKCTFIGLDEWVGMDRHADGSCKGFMYDRLFIPLNIQESNIYFFDACADNLDKECSRIDGIIARKGGIDLLFAGVGMNGHIGLNEPGSDFGALSHIVELDAVTVTVGQKYFKNPTQMSKGITIGMRQVMEAGAVILAASGERKAENVNKLVNGEITGRVPASILQKHRNCSLMLDQDAARKL